MAWTDIVVAGLFVVALALSAWQAYYEDWAARRLLGAVLFLGGAAATLFLDELLSLPWLELVGAGLMLVGALLTWRANGDAPAPSAEEDSGDDTTGVTDDAPVGGIDDEPASVTDDNAPAGVSNDDTSASVADDDDADAPASASDDEPDRILALGDSYTIGTSIDADERWVSKLAARLRGEGKAVADPVVIAENGWTTGDLDEAIDEAVAGAQSAGEGTAVAGAQSAGEGTAVAGMQSAGDGDADAGVAGPFDLVTLLIGANNCFQGEPPAEFEPKFRSMLDRALGFAPDPDSVVVITVPDYTLTPVGQENDPEAHAERLERYNEIIREAASEKRTRLVDVVPPSKRVAEEPGLIAEDDLHPAPAQHDLWLDRIYPVAAEALD